MERKNAINNTLTIQDDSAKNIYDINDFTRKLNNLALVLDPYQFVATDNKIYKKKETLPDGSIKTVTGLVFPPQNIKYWSPMQHYANKIKGDSSICNRFLEFASQMVDQLNDNFLERLKGRHLPVVIPNADEFLLTYMDALKKSDAEFDRIIAKEALKFYDALNISVSKNIQTGKTYGITYKESDVRTK